MLAMKDEERIVLRVTSEQKTTLASLAKIHGITLSNYIRRKLDLPPDQQGKRKDLAKRA